MAQKVCFNDLCGTTSSPEWKTGWRLRSGQLALLCFKCGSAFERRTYCDEYHANDSGWRYCRVCGKRLHCGCAASLPFIALVESGGVRCIDCPKDAKLKSNLCDGDCDATGPFILIENNADIIKKFISYNGSNGQPSIIHNAETNATLGRVEKEKHLIPVKEVGSTCGSNLTKPNLNIALGASTGNVHSVSSLVNDERDQRRTSTAVFQGFFSHHLLPRGFAPPSGANVSEVPAMRVARPSAEVRGRHQLLLRNWPRITDKELQQITGESSNCSIVPLFEKVLSASDASRIGRLVLPKACAEAYFPPISQPEGVPMKIRDVNGMEWGFQYRFWPNNNSRMYVLEGVAPYLQSMELEAGDTVTFSRIDPEGKFFIGFRRKSKLVREKDAGSSSVYNGEKHGGQTEEGPIPLKKKRNARSRRKRFLVDNEDILTMRSAKDVQGLLRPPPSAKPNIVMVDDQEFEEYEEPPVIGKSSIFTARLSGLVEQWTQCDSCSKWRRLPADILLPPSWTCTDNAWDHNRSFCSAPNELSAKELEDILQQSNDSKKRKTVMNESSGLDALANAVTVGIDIGDLGSSSAAATTKHPRHRPGCLCIVCIQPPSGKGNHKSNCTCIVCKAVRRRFRAIMMRRKKRRSQQRRRKIASIYHLKQSPNHEKEDDKPGESENSCGSNENLKVELSKIYDRLLNESGKALDQNGHPEQEEDSTAWPTQVSLMNFLQLNALTSLASKQQASNASELEASNASGQVADNHPITQHNQVELSNESSKTLDQNGHRELEENSTAGPAQATVTNLLKLNDLTSLASKQGQVADNHPLTEYIQVKPSHIIDGLSNESGKALDQTGHPEEDSRGVLAQATVTNLIQLNDLTSLASDQQASNASKQQTSYASEQGQIADNHPVTQHKQVELLNESGKTHDQNGHPELEEDSREGLAQVTVTNLLQLNALTSLALEQQASNVSEQQASNASEQGQVSDHHPVTQHKQVELSNESAKTLDQIGHPELDDVSREGMNLLQLDALISFSEHQASNAAGQVTDNYPVNQHKQVELSNESGKTLDQNDHPELEEDSRAGPAQATVMNLLQLNALISLASEQQASNASEQVADNHPVNQHKKVKLSNETGKILEQNGHPELEKDSRAGPAQVTVTNLLQLNARTSLASGQQASNVSEEGQVADKEANVSEEDQVADKQANVSEGGQVANKQANVSEEEQVAVKQTNVLRKDKLLTNKPMYLRKHKLLTKKPI